MSKQEKRERVRRAKEAHAKQKARHRTGKKLQRLDRERSAKVGLAYAKERRPESVFESWVFSHERRLGTNYGRLLRLSQRVVKVAPKLMDESYREGMIALAEDATWVRPIQEWKPDGKAADRQMRSLVKYLLVQFPLPEFLYSVFTGGFVGDAVAVKVFVHLAQGGSLHKATKGVAPILPVPLTKRMCHLFMQSTTKLNFVSAVRHAQVETYGGERRTAEAICRARQTGRDTLTGNEEFWATVIQWTCNQGMLAPSQIPHIYDWIEHARNEALRARTLFSMKGRTAVSVVRAMDEWHGQLALDRRVHGCVFEPSGLDGGSYERKARICPGSPEHIEQWTIREILTSRELAEEGRRLHHCVATYGRDIENKRCSMWSLQVDGTRTLTIEVITRRRSVVQVAGRWNRNPTALELNFVRRWVATNNLTMSRW